MARRLLSAMARMRGGPTLGGSNTRVYVYDDEALTTPSTIYRRSTGVGEQPNPLNPNAGRSTSLVGDRLAAHTFVDVASVAGFQVGEMVPIYDGVNTAYKVITAIDGGLKRLTVDQALDFDFDEVDTVVGNADMRGHIWGWLEDTRDYFVQTVDVASGRVLPPLLMPTQVPNATIAGFEEGGAVASRGAINAVGTAFTLTDSGTALVLTHGTLASHTGLLPASSFDDTAHGARTGPTNAHEYDDITGLADHSARHESGGADVMAIDAAVGTGSLRTLGYGSGKALNGAGLTTAEADLSGDVPMTNANQYYDGPSVSLAAGTWFIVGTVTIGVGANDQTHTAKLWDGTTVESSTQTEFSGAAGAGDAMSLSLSGIVVLGSTTTMKISAAWQVGGGGGPIYAAAPRNGAGNNASHIRAVRFA